jgi:hypothetical protein
LQELSQTDSGYGVMGDAMTLYRGNVNRPFGRKYSKRVIRSQEIRSSASLGHSDSRNYAARAMVDLIYRPLGELVRRRSITPSTVLLPRDEPHNLDYYDNLVYAPPEDL